MATQGTENTTVRLGSLQSGRPLKPHRVRSWDASWVPARCGGGPRRPVALLRRAPKESVDYCPMGSPVLDTTKHLEVTRSRHSLRRSLVDRILLLTGLYRTLNAQF
jgi:hypothetical protein